MLLSFEMTCLYLQAEKMLFDKGLDHEYASIGGLPDFASEAAKLALGASNPVLQEKRVRSVVKVHKTHFLRRMSQCNRFRAQARCALAPHFW